ncbi:MAG: dihydrolipoamide acetyltransferase, partial [Lysobacterales bacterium]
MPQFTEVKVPDIGDFDDIEVIEIVVAAGDRVQVEQALITLESDKATMDVPSPAAGVVTGLAVAVGDRVSKGSLILTLEEDGDSASAGTDTAAEGAQPDASSDARPAAA